MRLTSSTNTNESCVARLRIMDIELISTAKVESERSIESANDQSVVAICQIDSPLFERRVSSASTGRKHA